MRESGAIRILRCENKACRYSTPSMGGLSLHRQCPVCGSEMKYVEPGDPDADA